MQQILRLLLLLLVSLSLQAEIYRGINAEGNVVFSDKEIPNSEKIPMPTPNITQMPKPVPVEPTTEDSVDSANYRSFKIEQPENNGTIRENNGNVSISLELTPDLNTKAGHTISIVVDGKVVTRATTALTTQLSNINRGSHTIKAHVNDKDNKTIITSNTVEFHMKRFSVQHPQSSGPAIGPVNADGTLIKPGPQNLAFKPGPIFLPPAP